ncbi:MAG: hypothetical protein EOP50_20790 [Sphingobacteriales bacterium]|nr:MAG: hypothetical protein EOP50_20790 [Sphingobacteriales bacterium]
MFRFTVFTPCLLGLLGWLLSLSLLLPAIGMADVSTGAAGQPLAPLEPGAVISSVGRFLRISGGEASRQHPVRIEGTVVQTRPQDGTLLLRDSTGVLEVKLDLEKYPVQAGQQVLMEGHTNERAQRYPDLPGSRFHMGALEKISGINLPHITRVRGYIHPPATGTYHFACWL